MQTAEAVPKAQVGLRNLISKGLTAKFSERRSRPLQRKVRADPLIRHGAPLQLRFSQEALQRDDDAP